MRKRRGSYETTRLERQQNIEDLLTISILLHLGDLPTATIRDARLRDLGGVDGVVAFDVFRPHDAGHNQLTDFEVDAYFLPTLNHQISVGQHLRYNSGNVRLEFFGSINGALAIHGRAGIGREDARRDWRVHNRDFGFAEEIADAGVLRHFATAFGF